MAKPIRKPEAIDSREMRTYFPRNPKVRSKRMNERLSRLRAERRRQRRTALKRDTDQQVKEEG